VTSEIRIVQAIRGHYVTENLTNQVVAVVVHNAALATAIVERFAAAGARVQRIDPASLDRDPDGMPDVRPVVDGLVRREGRLDVWIQEAHSETAGEVQTLSRSAWKAGLDAGLGLAFASAQATGAVMLAQGGGAVVFLTSVDGLFASSGRAVACCGAAAVAMLVKVLACEWAFRGVRVNAVSTTTWLAPPRGPDSVELTAAGISPTRIPLGRAPQPDEVAEAVFYLGSPQSSFVTGENLRLDGGWAGYQLF
jgi:NAD(P)-dependent dehydrogenase (short-subunit alcohol dehydrogenase family)